MSKREFQSSGDWIEKSKAKRHSRSRASKKENNKSNSKKDDKPQTFEEKYNDKLVRVYKKVIGNCIACCDKKTLVTISGECKHDPIYCLECIGKTIDGEMISKGVSKFTCKTPKCRVEFDYSQFYTLLNGRKLSILDRLMTHRSLEKMTEFRWCKNPNGCGNGQLVSNWEDLRGYYSCHSCDQAMCFQHEIAWHNGFTCDEYQKELNNNNNFGSAEILSSFTKQCPNCKGKIAKLEGCDVMACCMYGTHGCQQNGKLFQNKEGCDHGGKQYCGQLFCWKCLGKIDIDKQNGAYIRHCKQSCQYAALN